MSAKSVRNRRRKERERQARKLAERVLRTLGSAPLHRALASVSTKQSGDPEVRS